MKKSIIRFLLIIFLFFIVFSNSSYAAELTINAEVSKTTIKPGEEVTVNIKFAEPLGAYTFNIAYDNAIFEYVSATGGTATDTSDEIIVLYYDTTGGTNPKENMSVTFKAKANITTVNPTEFMITAEGLANNDASVVYDDISVPIEKDVVVEPEYEDYVLKLEYPEKIIAGQDVEMKISYSSSMGRYYENARLIAEAKRPEGATAKLIGTDTDKKSYDIIKDGWGDPDGYEIGGKDISQVLNVEGSFDKSGDYKITLKLIDKKDNDKIIAEKTFDIAVQENNLQNQINTNNTNSSTNTNLLNQTLGSVQNVNNNTNTSKTPTQLPKTGINLYVVSAIIITALLGFFVYKNRKEE